MRATVTLLSILCTCVGTNAWSGSADDCRQRVHREIDRLNALMRQGYTARQGVRYQALRKELGDLRARCDRDHQAWKAIPRF